MCMPRYLLLQHLGFSCWVLRSRVGHLIIGVDVTFPEAFNPTKDLQPEARRGTTRHRVLKVIPGCPQGSRLWHAHLSAFLRDRGFVPVAPQEECLFTERDRSEAPARDKNSVRVLLWTTTLMVSMRES